MSNYIDTSMFTLIVLCSVIGSSFARNSPNELRVKPADFGIINIQIVVDAKSLYEDYLGKNVSKNDLKPTDLTQKSKYAFMIASEANIISGQATAELHIQSSVGDFVRWFAASESHNVDIGVKVYNITRTNASQKILSLPKIGHSLNNIMCSRLTTNGLDALTGEPCRINYVESKVIGVGDATYKVSVAMYIRSNVTRKQELFGYFRWDSKITAIDDEYELPIDDEYEPLSES